MSFPKVFFYIFLFISGEYVFGQGQGQSETLFVTCLGVEQGLRQSMVRGITQNSNGLMWMTTGDGLHYFDGKEFTAFRVPINGVYNHADNLMGDMTESSPGILTISSSSSILRFNTSTGIFEVVFRKDDSYPILLDQVIGGKPLAWTHEIKLCLVGDDRISPIHLSFDHKHPLPENFLPDHAVLSKFNELLISNDEGFIIVNPGNRRETGTSFKATWIAVPNMQAMASDKLGHVFILANGIIYQYLGRGILQTYMDTRITEEFGLFIDSRDNFWLTSRKSSKQYRLSNGILHELRFYFHDGKHIDSIAPEIRTVFEDDHHNIWFGTDGDGVLLYAPEHIHFLRADIGFTRCITWFNNEIWAGTYNNGLWRISSDLSEARRIKPGHGRKELYYLDLAADRKGHLWVATRQGLEVLDKNGRTLFRQDFICRSAKLLVHSRDTVILFRDNQLSIFCTGDRFKEIGSRDYVSVNAFLTPGSSHWIGNRYGLYRTRKTFWDDKDVLSVSRNQLSANAVYSLLEQNGRIWSATSNGIEIFDLDGKKESMRGVLKELQNEMIYSLLPDERGQVWFAGNHGIGCINIEKDRIIYFGAGNNLQSLEFNSNAACRTPDGKIYFGGIDGINGFDPSWFNPEAKKQKVRLLSLIISDSALTGGIPSGKTEVTLNRRAPHISGKIFCSDYTNAGLQLFSFYLEGYQQGWSKPSPVAEFNYRDLPPGNYRLLAKCADPWQNWGDPEILFSVTLNPPFWKTGWFLLLFIALITMATGLLVRKINSMRYAKQILALEQQNAVEKERLRISKDMHDDLGASLTRIAILTELAKKQQDDPVKSHQIIEQISDISGGVVDDMSEIIWAMNPRNDTLDSFTSHIRQYASSYLESAGIDGRVAFPDKIPELPMSSEFRRNLFLTVKEALHNVVKHAGASNVNIHLVIEGHLVQIIIMDNGKGFNVERTQGWGNGLINMRKRIEEHGGRFQITSGEGTGTKIEISIKLP